MLKLSRSKLGRWGEDLVAKFCGWTRVPYSGAQWPHKQDLVRIVPNMRMQELGQCKTTATDDQTGFLRAWLELAKDAKGDNREPVWVEVYKTDWEAYIFEKRLVRKVRLGVGGDAV